MDAKSFENPLQIDVKNSLQKSSKFEQICKGFLMDLESGVTLISLVSRGRRAHFYTFGYFFLHRFLHWIWNHVCNYFTSILFSIRFQNAFKNLSQKMM